MRFALFWQCHPVLTAGFEQGVGANNVGLYKFSRPGDRAIYVTLCCEMHHRIRLMFGKNFRQRNAVANVDMAEGVTRVVTDRFQRFKVARIGQFINVNHLITGVIDNMTDHS